MAKDFTDYVALILEAEKRVYHIYHFRSKFTTDDEFIPHNGRDYVFDRDRAYRVGWAPWKKWNSRKPFHSINEFLRSKKIGLLLYHEPLPSEPLYRDVEHKIPREYICKICGFTTVHLPGMKTHMTRRHKLKEFGNQLKVAFDVKIEKLPYFHPIQPIHISRMHQPSGEMKE